MLTLPAEPVMPPGLEDPPRRPPSQNATAYGARKHAAGNLGNVHSARRSSGAGAQEIVCAMRDIASRRDGDYWPPRPPPVDPWRAQLTILYRQGTSPELVRSGPERGRHRYGLKIVLILAPA